MATVAATHFLNDTLNISSFSILKRHRPGLGTVKETSIDRNSVQFSMHRRQRRSVIGRLLGYARALLGAMPSLIPLNDGVML